MKKLKFITAVFTALVSAMLACMLIGCPNAARNSDKEKTVAVTGVRLNKQAVSLDVGAVETLTATVTPANAANKNVTWNSDKTDIAAVDSNGKVTAKKAGKAVITVTTQDGGKKATCNVTVKAKTEVVKVTGVTLNKTDTSLDVGDEETLTATVAPANATNKNLTWSSGKQDIAEVDSNGKVTAKKAGKAVITVTTQDGNFTATCNVTVKAKTVAVTGVTLNKTDTSLNIGDEETLTATVAPANAINKNVTWSSDKQDIAEVDSNGKVTAKKEGKAVITVTTQDGNFTATCSVKVNPLLKKDTAVLILSPAQKEIKIMAETEDDTKITVEGCTETSFSSSWDDAATLHATGEKVVLKGKIIKLSCSDNNLTALNVQGLTRLKILNCYDNQLIALNVYGLTSLNELICNNNQLTALNVNGLTGLKTLNCYGNKLTALNIQGCTSLEELKCFKNQLTKFNIQDCTSLQELYCEANQLTELNVQSLTGLKVLKCSNNKLKVLNTNGCTSLKSLYCGGDQLTELIVQGCTSLKDLHCNAGQLTELNVQGLTDLENLGCEANQLTKLNLQGLVYLKSLYCGGNQLTELNVQGLTNLQYLGCENNKLDKAAFTKLFKDLPTKSTMQEGECLLYTEQSGITEGNYKAFTKEELKVIKNKNWIPKKRNSEGKKAEIE